MVLTLTGPVAGFHQQAVLTTPYQPAAPGYSGYLKPPALVSTVPSILARAQAEVQATAVPTPSPAPATPSPTPAPPPAFVTYTIQPGDSVSSIATAFGIDSQYIMWNNPEVNEDPDMLLIGATLLIPSVNGIVYNVKLGDTLSDIAAYYKIDVQSITGFQGNNIASPDTVIEGMVLLLPGAEPPPPPPPPPPPEPEPAPVSAPAPAYEPAPAPAPAPAPSYSSGYIWPYLDSITQYFSAGHRGIDIDGFGRYGAPILAAADGQVVLASWSSYGYGNYVIVRHSDGSETLYAHLSDIWVSQGQYVSQGEGIGALGSTGYSTGPHLHFEVHIGGGAVDPLAYLP